MHVILIPRIGSHIVKRYILDHSDPNLETVSFHKCEKSVAFEGVDSL